VTKSRLITPKEGLCAPPKRVDVRESVRQFILDFDLEYRSLVGRQKVILPGAPRLLQRRIFDCLLSLLRTNEERPEGDLLIRLGWNKTSSEFSFTTLEGHLKQATAQFRECRLCQVVRRISSGYTVVIEPSEQLVALGEAQFQKFLTELSPEQQSRLGTCIAEAYQRETGEAAAFVTFSNVLTQLLGVQEASEKLKRSRNRVTSYAKEGILPAVRLGERQYLFFKKHLDEFSPLKKGPKGPRKRRNGD
jgi:hypothetical protein